MRSKSDYFVFGGQGRWWAIGYWINHRPFAAHTMRLDLQGVVYWAFTGRTPYEALERLKTYQRKINQ